jgi:hypothetical protein
VMARDFYPFNSTSLVVAEGDYAVIQNRNGHLCGYMVLPAAEVPEEWHGDYDAPGLQYLNVHGGITYCRVNGDQVVFGFDCADAGDDENRLLRFPRHVLALAEDMGRQLRAFASVYDEFKAADREKRISILENIREKAVFKEEIGFGGLLDMMAGGTSLDPSDGDNGGEQR